MKKFALAICGILLMTSVSEAGHLRHRRAREGCSGGSGGSGTAVGVGCQGGSAIQTLPAPTPMPMPEKAPAKMGSYGSISTTIPVTVTATVGVGVGDDCASEGRSGLRGRNPARVIRRHAYIRNNY